MVNLHRCLLIIARFSHLRVRDLCDRHDLLFLPVPYIRRIDFYLAGTSMSWLSLIFFLAIERLVHLATAENAGRFIESKVITVICGIGACSVSNAAEPFVTV